MALPIFVITIFVSAFLLFLVQPIVGKLILPKLGGTPQVWNTCMVFFQSVLLLGYAYTHTVSTRLKLRQQLMLHCGLLAIPVLLMLAFPMYERVQGWSPPPGANPIVETLVLLATIIGVPFFVVSTSAPLLQRWFGYSGHATAKDPYFLYAASNLGSLLSLFFYPALIEPITLLPSQSWIWFVGYIILAVLILYCAYVIFKVAPPDSVLAAEAAVAAAAAQAPAPTSELPAPVPAPVAESSTALKSGPAPGARGIQRKKGMKIGGKLDEEKSIAVRDGIPDTAYGAHAEMTMWRRIRWVLLAAVPSSLMLGVTSYISTDLSPFPLVWIIPLALYLLSFILVYLKFWTGRTVFTFGGGYTLHDATIFVLQPIGILILCFIVLTRRFDPFFATTLIMGGFFANALACHGELARDRPATRYLTDYFLCMSLGGMIGGLFNGIIAPIVFQRGVIEFPIAIVIACLVRPLYVHSGWFEELLYSAFPGLQSWVRSQGDEMAKSMGRTPPNSTYLFSYFLDVVFGLFIWSIVYWLTLYFNDEANLLAVAKYVPMATRKGEVTESGALITRNIFVFFIPMVFCFFFAGRPLRMGLAVGALLFAYMYSASSDDANLVEARRTYFGMLKVMTSSERARDKEENDMFYDEPLPPSLISKDGSKLAPPYPFTYLMHGTTYHGRNYLTDVSDDFKRNRKDLSRLATTYYHRYGPVGVVMERYNWVTFPGGALPGGTPKGVGAQNAFYGDMRMPTSIVGQVAASLGVGNLPIGAIVEPWSEPPYATIGLGTGTMASYARPYQHMTYYEIDDVIREFSLPREGKGHFTYLQNAIKRGVNMEVIMGDARQSLETDREKNNRDNSFIYSFDFDKKKFNEPVHSPSAMFPNREHYYKVINVDAFSSDAIPVHLCTKQAIKLYMDKLTMDGVLCMHTSNRHMDLVIPVARIVLELSEEAVKKAEEDAEGLRLTGKEREAYVDARKIHCRVGKDGRDRYMGHFSSEYVMIYRGAGYTDYLEGLRRKKTELVTDKQMRSDGGAPDGYQILNSVVQWDDPFVTHPRYRGGRPVDAPVKKSDSLWTDDYSHILGVLR